MVVPRRLSCELRAHAHSNYLTNDAHLALPLRQALCCRPTPTDSGAWKVHRLLPDVSYSLHTKVGGTDYALGIVGPPVESYCG